MKSDLSSNKKGFSMIQVLVAAAITSIISLGVVSMLETSRRNQRRTMLMATLNELKLRIQTNLMDQTAFNNTINSNTTSPFLQIQQGNLVTENGASTAVKFVMYDAAGSGWDMLGTAASDTGTYAGFTEKGTACTGFSPTLGSGTDNCPISYRFLVYANCRIGTTCKDPELTLAARLVFNPSNGSTSVLNNWRGVIPQGGSSLLNSPQKFDVEIKRTASSLAKYFYISASVNPSVWVDCKTANSTNSGGGTCSTTGAMHPLTQVSASTGAAGWVIESDANSLVTVTQATGTFSFANTGYYKCNVVAQAYGTNVAFWLYDSTAGTGVATSSTATAVAGASSTGEAHLTVSFNATAGNQYKLYQKCESTTPMSCSLGFASGTLTADTERLTSIVCERLDASF